MPRYIDVFKNNHYEKCKVTDFGVYEQYNRLFLSLTFVSDDGRTVKEVKVPRIDLGIDINNGRFNLRYEREPEERCLFETHLRQYETLIGETDEANHVFYTEKILEERPKEMTMEELEKALGYKVKIVTKKEK